MSQKDIILKRQKFNTRFKNEDMDFTFNWYLGIGQIIGISPSQVFYAVHDVKDGDSAGWTKGFKDLGISQEQQAEQFVSNGLRVAASQVYFASAYAYRASIQYTDVTSAEFEKSTFKGWKILFSKVWSNSVYICAQ